MTGSVHLVTGEDPSLRDRTVDRLVEDLLGDDDRSLALEEIVVGSRRSNDDSDDTPNEGSEFSQLLTALNSPPFMTERRVVVARDVGGLSAQQVTVLAEWLDDPPEAVAVVFVAGGGRLSTKLSKAVDAAGGDRHSPAAEARAKRGEGGRVAKQLTLSTADAGITLDDAARDLVTRHLGEDAGRVPELVEMLHSTYGGGARLGASDVEPYLGESGTVNRYELANAIDEGRVEEALRVLDRMLHSTSAVQAKPLHPMQVMASLQFHYRDLLRLDDPSIATKEQAADALGMKSPWAARHRLDAARVLGSEGLRDAYSLLAQADIDLRGASGVPEETVVEVLVARLASLARRRGAAGKGRAR